MKTSTVVSSLAVWATAASAIVVRRGSNRTDPSYYNGTQPEDPCAAIASIVAENPAAQFPPSIAWECLQSVPLDVEGSIAMIDYIIPYMELNSIVDYVNNPGPEYLVPGIDLIGGYTEIRDKLEAGDYKSQIDFAADVRKVALRAQDGHLVMKLPLTGIFVFETGIGVMSVSEDGVSTPKPFNFLDLQKTQALGHKYTPSFIAKVNGIDAVEYFEELSTGSNYHDPDAMYNNVFENLARQAYGRNGLFPAVEIDSPLPDNTTLIFANGTETTRQNIARLGALGTAIDWKPIKSGADLFNAIEHPVTTSSISSTNSTNNTTATPDISSSELPPITPWPNYPWPYEMQRYNSFMTSYFLNSSSYNSIGVVAINSFSATDESKILPDYGDVFEYIRAMEVYMKEFVRQGRKKLILDMTSNGGGNTFLAMYTFQLLFGGVRPYDAIHMRATPVLDFIGQNTFNYSEEETPYIISTWLDENNKPYDSWDSMFGPVELGEAKSLQTNAISHGYAAALEALIEAGTISAYTNIVPKDYFKPEDIIILTDGECASACPFFINYMTYTKSVRTIAIGGRPIPQPMQSRGGTRGGEVWAYDVWGSAVQLALNVSDSIIPEGLSLPDYNSPPMAISVFRLNGQNLYNPNEANPAAPLQYTYEAANCKTFYTAETAMSPTSLWEHVADIAWGGAKCVPGSTVNGDGTIGDQTPGFTQDVYSTAVFPIVPGGFKTVSENTKKSEDVKRAVRVPVTDRFVVRENVPRPKIDGKKVWPMGSEH